MIKTNHLTIEIQDTNSQSKITIELTNETMYKLYRIKEMHNYQDTIEIDAYTRFCDAIKETVNAFIDSISQEYLETLADVENGNLEKDDVHDVIASMDNLIKAGYGYDFALKQSKKYFK